MPSSLLALATVVDDLRLFNRDTSKHRTKAMISWRTDGMQFCYGLFSSFFCEWPMFVNDPQWPTYVVFIISKTSNVRQSYVVFLWMLTKIYNTLLVVFLEFNWSASANFRITMWQVRNKTIEDAELRKTFSNFNNFVANCCKCGDYHLSAPLTSHYAMMTFVLMRYILECWRVLQ